MKISSKFFEKVRNSTLTRMHICISNIECVPMPLTRFSGSETCNYILKETLNKCFKNTFLKS